MTGAVTLSVRSCAYDDRATASGERTVPVEMPVAIETNGITYAVMMATPVDLDDFVTGFLLSERLIDTGDLDAIGAVDLHDIADGTGMVARINLPPARLAPVMDRARRRLGDSSCGICGIESIEAVLRPLPVLTMRSHATPRAIRAALTALPDRQRLGMATAATHAAAFCDDDGTVRLVREDVGRHNALDKLIGAMARGGIAAAGGFMLVTSRCSFELVEKVVVAGCPLLVSISAPTDLAVRRAEAAGLSLAVLARHDTMLWATRPMMESSNGL